MGHTHSEGSQDDGVGVDRRSVLRTTGAVTAAGLLAGCMGGGGGSSGYTLTTATPDTMAFALSSEIANVVNSNTDVELQAEASSGSNESLAQLVQGATDLGYSDGYAVNQAIEGEGDFSEVEFERELMQVMSYYWIQVSLVAPMDSDIEMMDDLEGVSWTSGTRGATFQNPLFTALEHVHGEGFVDDTFVDVEYGQLADALAGGQVEVSGGPLNINGTPPSYIQQLYSQHDLRLLGWSDEARQAIDEDPTLATMTASVDDDAYSDVVEFSTGEESSTIAAQYLLLANENIPADAVTDAMGALWDAREDLQETHAGFSEWADEEFWTAHILPDVPVHPGAADFFKEHDMWSDDWTEGSL